MLSVSLSALNEVMVGLVYSVRRGMWRDGKATGDELAGQISFQQGGDGANPSLSHAGAKETIFIGHLTCIPLASTLRLCDLIIGQTSSKIKIPIH